MLYYDDEYWMAEAIKRAKFAAEQNEVPVGALLISDHRVVGEGANQSVIQHNPTAHAEIIALKQAGAHLGNYRLLHTSLYVTLEPCIMCVGAMIHARISRLVFGAYDHKTGAAGSFINLLALSGVNHKIVVRGGVLEQACSETIRNFFQMRRKEIKERKRR